MANKDIERINFTYLPSANSGKKITHRTRAENKRITGICMVKNTMLDHGQIMMSLFIDKKEVFPSDFDPSLIMCDSGIDVNSRFYKYINREINQSDIDIIITGGVSASNNFSLLLECEQDG